VKERKEFVERLEYQALKRQKGVKHRDVQGYSEGQTGHSSGPLPASTWMNHSASVEEKKEKKRKEKKNYASVKKVNQCGSRILMYFEYCMMVSTTLIDVQ
jgi:hypothetical protein